MLSNLHEIPICQIPTLTLPCPEARLRAGRLGHQRRLAGQHGLVAAAAPGHHLAVHRHALARQHLPQGQRPSGRPIRRPLGVHQAVGRRPSGVQSARGATGPRSRCCPATASARSPGSACARQRSVRLIQSLRTGFRGTTSQRACLAAPARTAPSRYRQLWPTPTTGPPRIWLLLLLSSLCSTAPGQRKRAAVHQQEVACAHARRGHLHRILPGRRCGGRRPRRNQRYRGRWRFRRRGRAGRSCARRRRAQQQPRLRRDQPGQRAQVRCGPSARPHVSQAPGAKLTTPHACCDAPPPSVTV